MKHIFYKGKILNYTLEILGQYELPPQTGKPYIFSPSTISQINYPRTQTGLVVVLCGRPVSDLFLINEPHLSISHPLSSPSPLYLSLLSLFLSSPSITSRTAAACNSARPWSQACDLRLVGGGERDSRSHQHSGQLEATELGRPAVADAQLIEGCS